ncbi:hypothetical protein UVI_02015670 [Ustilaginoidea virens]|nr:hypothetical protein UVI_02015670 [Ustilaginoidea virens]
MCARNSASSVMKTLQNPSPSPGWAGRDIEADTISKRRPLPTNQGEKRPAAEVEGIVAKALAKQEARGPTVRGESFEGIFPGQKKDRRAIDKTAEAKPAAIDEVGQSTRGNHGGVGKGAAQDARKDVGEIAAEKATESDQARVCDSSQEHRGVVGVGYPSTFTESSAVVGCQILQTTPGGALGSRTRRLLEIAWCHIVAFLLVYWEKVGPVFDARSDYWARNSRKEATLEDCYVLVLAVPAGVLAVASIVWAMRLATICGENAELLKEWLSDVLWCF